MRAAILILVLAVSYAQQTGGQQNISTGNISTPPSDNQQQIGGCKLRCRKLTFIGEGSVPVKPNWALIDLSVEVNSLQLQGSSMSNDSSSSGGQSAELQAAKKVREEAQHRSMFILNYLKDLNTQDLRNLETQEISFKPFYDDDKFQGYKATFGLRFKVKIDKFQDVLDHIVSESGANRVDSIVFVPDEEVEEQANIKAIELASSNAWAQAQAVQKVMGIQGTLKLLSVRDKILPVKKLVRRFARRLMDNDDNEMDMDDMDWNDPQQMLNWLQGDQIVNALLVFKFDFEDGTINFKEVAKNQTTLSVQDAFGPLLSRQNQTMSTTQPATTQPPQPIETQPVQPVATNATVILPNNTAEMKPVETQPGGLPAQPVPTQPVNPP